jgi:hypothetical protein
MWKVGKLGSIHKMKLLLNRLINHGDFVEENKKVT